MVVVSLNVVVLGVVEVYVVVVEGDMVVMVASIFKIDCNPYN